VLPPWLHAQPRRLVTALPTTNSANALYSYRWLCIGPLATESFKAAPKGAKTRIYRNSTTKNPIRVYSSRAKHAFSERTAGAPGQKADDRMSRHQRQHDVGGRKGRRHNLVSGLRALPHCQGQSTMLGRQPHNLPSPPHSFATLPLDSPKASLRSRGLHSLTASLLYNTTTIPSQETPQRCHTTLHTSTSLLQSWGLHHHSGILHSRHMLKQRSHEQMTPRAHANT
jgi:hypothetical protein